MTLLVALAAGITVVLAASGWAGRPDGVATSPRSGAPGPDGASEPVVPASSAAFTRHPLGLDGRVGRVGRDGRRASERVGGRLPPRAVGRVVAVALPVVAAVAFGPLAAVVMVVFAVGARVATIRRVRRRANRLLDQVLPELIDLLIIAASAGQPVPSCLASVSERAPIPLRPVLMRAHHRVQRGESVSVALTDAGSGLGALGPVVVEALVVAHRTGAPLQPALQRVAAVARDRRSRAAEEAARRLPVTLLFPLVCCVLPAFVLLAVVPLLATSLQSLQI